MSTLRDLTIGIDFSEINIKELLQIEDSLDNIEDQFADMDEYTNDASRDFREFGNNADDALNQVRRDTHMASDAMDEFGDETQAAGIQASNSIDNVEDEVEELTGALMMMNMMAATSMQNMNGGFNRMNSGVLGLRNRVAIFGTVLVAALSAGVAAAGPLTAAVGSIASSLTVAGIGAGAFGAVAVGALTRVFEASQEVEKIQEKIADADTWKEQQEAQKELTKLYDGMSEAQRGALTELQEFKGFWTDFVTQFEQPVFDLFASTLEFIQGMLERLAPTIKTMADVFNDLMDELNTDLKYDDDFREFFEWLEGNAARSMENFANIAGNVLGGFFNLMEAFTPISEDVENGLLDMTERFEEWSDNLESNKGFQNFIEYAKENGPILLATLGEIVELGENIVKSLAPIGTEILEGIRDFTGAINDNWPAVEDTVWALSAAVGSFAAIMGGLKVIGFVNALMIAFQTQTVAATLSAWGFNAALWANPITWVVAGVAALIGIIVLLVRNWDAVSEALLGVWETVKTAWGNIWDSTKEVWYKVRTVVTDEINGIIGKINDMIETINKVPGVNVPIVPKVEKPKMPESMAQDAGLSPMAFNGSHANGLANVPFDNYAANLHKDEAVLTANQNKALQESGILSRRGDRPQTNITKGSHYTTNQTTFAPSINVEVSGNDNPDSVAKKAAKAARDEMAKFWRQMNAREA